jgi:hypothetical protein
MKATIKVWFAPVDLNDIKEVLTLVTEHGDFEIEVMAIRDQPDLRFETEDNFINCGCVLAGGALRKVVTLTNFGGEGAFRFIAPKDCLNKDDYFYDNLEDGSTSFVAGPFRLTPASFYVERHSAIQVEVDFQDNSSLPVGQNIFDFAVECDNFTSITAEVGATVDALRVELQEFETADGTQRPQVRRKILTYAELS